MYTGISKSLGRIGKVSNLSMFYEIRLWKGFVPTQNGVQASTFKSESHLQCPAWDESLASSDIAAAVPGNMIGQLPARNQL